MELKELLSKYTVDGNIDFEKAETEYQEHINGIVTKNVKKEVGKKEAEVMSSFISELGIEANDLDGVKKWVGVMKDNTNDYKDTNVKLESQLQETLKKQNALQSEYVNFKQDTLIGSLGVKDEEAEFLKYKFNKNVSDDVTFESLVDNYKKENRITTNKEINNNFEDHNESSPLEALKKIREK